MGNTAPDGWHVEVVDQAAGWDALREPWNALLAESAQPSIFLTWEWLNTWWRHRRRGESLLILLAWTGDGRLAGIAPWMRVEEKAGPLRVRRVVFIGTGFAYPAHMDVIARLEDRAAAGAAFLRFLDRHPNLWDLLELECLAETSALGAGADGVRGKWLERAPQPAPYIGLPESWVAYEEQGLAPSHRQQVRTRRRKLLRDFPGRVEYRQVNTAGELAPALDALAGLSERRWRDKGMASSFSRRAFEAFFREVTATMLDCNALRLNVLRVDDEVIAAHCGFRYQGVVYGYQTSFDTGWAKYRPGQLIQAQVVQQAIEEGAGEYDLLQGANEYKFFWTERMRSERHRVLSRSLVGHTWSFGHWLFERAKLLARRKLPKAWQARIENRMNRRAG